MLGIVPKNGPHHTHDYANKHCIISPSMNNLLRGLKNHQHPKPDMGEGAYRVLGVSSDATDARADATDTTKD